MNIGDGLTMKVFFIHLLGLSPPRDAHTHAYAKMMSAPENGSLFTSEWIQHFANKIYYKFIVLNAADEFCMEIIFWNPHKRLAVMWCCQRTHRLNLTTRRLLLKLTIFTPFTGGTTGSVFSLPPKMLRCRCFIAVLFIAIHLITFHIVSRNVYIQNRYTDTHIYVVNSSKL